MQLRCLGPMGLFEADREQPLGGPKQRLVLAHLLIRANQTVPVDRLLSCGTTIRRRPRAAPCRATSPTSARPWAPTRSPGTDRGHHHDDCGSDGVGRARLLGADR